MYKQDAWSKILELDFTSKKNTIEKIHFNNTGINGTLENLKYNGVCICIRNLIVSEDFEEQVLNDFSLFKLLFSIKGSYHFSTLPLGKIIEVPQGYCNLYHLSKIRGVQKYTKKNTAIVEVLFTEDYLRDLLGESFKGLFGNRTGFLAHKNANCLWENGKTIPLKLIPFVIDILKCPYQGLARASFMKANVDCIILEFFLGKHNFITDQKVLPKMNYEDILKVDAYIKENLKKQLTIDHLSTIAGLNTTKLKHDFKKVFSTTIFKHITTLRMERAKQLILDNQYSIAEASYEVGYTNPQHFTVAFKKTMGYLPSKLKEKDF